jgi:enamine deaminase RidA (YjgF/YER057c/UK114 family)
MVAGGFAFSGGHVGARLNPPGQERTPASTLEEQADICLGHMEQLLLAGGATRDQVVEVSAFVVPHDDRDIVRQRTESFLGQKLPLLHIYKVDRVARLAMLEMDGIAVVDPDLSVARAMRILEPFGSSEALVRSGPFVIMNGLTAVGDSLGEQTTNLLARADLELQAAGSALSLAVKLTVFLGEFGTYPQFNDATKVAFARFEPPTRSVVVARGLAHGALVRINLIALAGSADGE